MQFLYPFIAMMAAWIAGRLVLTSLSLCVRSEALAIVIGISLLVILAGNASFLMFSLNRATALGIVALIMSGALIRWRKIFINIEFRDIFAIVIIFLGSEIYFLLPSFFHHSNIVLLDAGDYSSYASMGSWLQARSIRIPFDLSDNYSPIQFKLEDYQLHHLRLGALFLYAFYASMFGVRSIVLYTSYAAWLVAFQAVAFFGLARVVIPRSRTLPCTMVALVFAVNPLLTWTGYASFIPQIMGIGLMMSILAVSVRLIDVALDAEPINRSLSLVVVLGILLCANWSAYPEIMPIAFVIIAIYFVSISIQRRVAPARLIHLGGWVLASIVLAILLSPMTAYWGFKGLLDQIHMNPHGGEQIISVWTVLKTMMGASLEPLVPAVLDRTTSVEVLCEILIFSCASLGIFHIIRLGQISLVFAVAATGALLFWYVGRRYGYDPQHMESDSKALLTWNYFKATQYLAPLTFLLGWGGATHLLIGRPIISGPTRALRSSLLTLPVLAMVVLAWRQWERVDVTASYLNLPSRVANTFAKIPPGRVLVSLMGDSYFDTYRRWATYALMPDRSVVAVEDAPNFNYEVSRALDLNRPEILKSPISTVVSSSPPAQMGGANSADLSFDIRDTSREVRPFTVSTEGETSSYVSVPNSPVGQIAVSNVAVPQIAISSATGVKLFPVGNLSTVTTDAASLGVSGLMRVNGVPSQAGFVVEAGLGSGTDIASPAPRDIADLTPTIDQKMIADGGGGSMLWKSHDPGFDLAMNDFGFSRLLLRLHLKPGTYFFKIEFGDIRSEVQPGTGGFGAYIGFDGHRETDVDLSHAGNSTFYYRFVVPQEGDIACGLGFGAWGAARGRMHIQTIGLMGMD